MTRLARIPLLHQPGEAWLYNVGTDIAGVLMTRACEQPLPELMAERVFQPLGMVDTGFVVPADKRHRLPALYRPGEGGSMELVDPPLGEWSVMPGFPSGSGGLVTTLDDWYALGRMLLDRGRVGDGTFLQPTSVARMTTNHITAAQSAVAELFLEGQGWGYGGSVDVAVRDPWNVPGRYGWVGGTGTAAHVIPSTGCVAILFTQVELTGRRHLK
jgi:CubicO group peptidase (beta-lactamase class C family)